MPGGSGDDRATTGEGEDAPRVQRELDAPIRVLHVDDESVFADLTGEFLERADDRFDVVTESTASDGLDRLDEVDCVVSDYEMPEMDGIEFLNRVRERDEHLPFILFTGRGSEAVASDAIAAGVTDYLQKETGTDQYTVLANRIANAVEQDRSRAALAASQERLSLFIDQSPLGVIEWTPELEAVRVNDAAEEILGYSEADLRGDTWRRIVPTSDADHVADVVDELQADEGGYHSINENVTADGERIVCEWHNRVVTDDAGDVIAVFSQFQDVTERQERQHGLEALHETSRELIQASSATAVTDLATRAAKEVLGLRMNAVYLYDEAADALVPTAVSDLARERLDRVPTFERGEGIAWEVYESGADRVFDDVSAVEDRYNAETDVRSELVLPLGDHGILLAGTLETGVYGESDLALARILAANVEAALSRIEHEESLRESRQRYRTLVDNFPDGAVFLYDDDLRYLLAGGQELENVGLTAEEIIGETLYDVFPDEIVAEQEEYLRAALDGDAQTFEQSYRGEWYHVRAVPVGDDPDTAMLVSQNVTERRERLRELETLVDNLPGMTYRCRHESGWPMEEIRGDAEGLTGYTAEQIIDEEGFWWDEILHPDDRQPMWDAVQSAIDDGDSFEVTYRIRTRDDETKWLWERGRAVTDGEDDVISLEGFITDVTDRKAAEDRLEAFIDCASDVLAVVDESGTLRELSPSTERVTGHDPAAMEGSNVMKYVHPEDRDEVLATFQEMIEGEGTDPKRMRFRFRSADGSWQWLESVGSERTDTALDGYVVTSRDVTDRIEYERELERQNERLDEFAAVVSHDLRNPVNVANGYLELLAEDHDDDRIAEVERALDRIEGIVESLLTLARGGEESRETTVIDLSTAARNAWDTVDTGGATLTVDGDLRIRADDSRLGQLFENLFRNSVEHGSTSSRTKSDHAVEHDSTGGRPQGDGSLERDSVEPSTAEGEETVEHRFTDEASRSRRQAADLTVEVGPLADGDGFYVADDGEGIDPAERERICDAAYSTGDDGLGLGLAIVSRIANGHDWTLDVTESASGGARFEFAGVETD